MACLTFALIIAVFRFLARPRRWHPAVILGLLATSFATKETTYITVFIGGIFLIGLAVWEIRSGRTAREGSLIRAVREIGRDVWIWGVAAFAAVFTLLFTTFLTNPHGLQDGIVESIRYWLTQQPVNRGGQPWFYYLVVLPAYEWPVLLFAAIGAVTVVRRRTVFGLFLIWVFVANLVVFSWASERMPWLVLHMLLPAMLLAVAVFRRPGTAGTRLPGRPVWRSPDSACSSRPRRRSRSPTSGPPIHGSCSCTRRPRPTFRRWPTSSSS